MPNRVEGIGALQPKLMIVGEAPGQKEDETGIPFVGPTGEMLDDFLFKAGISRHECYITNVVKYRPPMNDFDKLHLIGVSLEDSIKELWENEINVLKPNCILAVGNVALNAICDLDGILNYRGSILLARDGTTKCIPTIHPAALFKKASNDESERSSGGLEWTYTKLIQADITRAVEESLTAELNLPSRTLSIAYNSLDLHRFFGEYSNLDKACIDIESINCVPVCIGFAFSRHHAISIPLLKRIGNNFLTDMGDNELDECWRMIDNQLRRLKLVGHNLMYDDYKLSLIGLQCPNVYSDTLIKVRVLFPELPIKKLHVLASLWTREPFYKEEGKEFRIGKKPIEQLLRYNGKDCVVDFEIDEVMENDLQSMGDSYNVPMMNYYYNYMMKKHKFYLRMANNGFAIDFVKKAELKKTYNEMREVVHKRLVEAVGQEINVKSPKQKYELLYKIMKLKIMKKAPTSEDTIVALMANHAKKKGHKEILEDILEESRIRDQLSRYINFQPDYDNRCKSTFNISATETCRSSTGILKKPLRPKKIGLAFHTVAKHGRLGKDIRSMQKADPGYILVKIDSSQAEARIVALLSEDWELLKAFDEIDIHRRTAGLMFGYHPKLELSKDFKHPLIDSLPKDGPERFTGKKIRHAGNYDMGKRRLMTEFNTDAQKYGIKMTISEWKAGQYLELFHSASPRIKGVFHTQIKEAIDSTRCLIDPFGGVRIFNGRYDEELYKEGYANIPQRTVAHLVQGGALRIEDEIQESKLTDYMWLSEDHDSLTLQAPENNWEPYAKLMKKHLEVPIDFSLYCTLKRNYKLVIPAEVEIGFNNADYQKVKL